MTICSYSTGKNASGNVPSLIFTAIDRQVRSELFATLSPYYDLEEAAGVGELMATVDGPGFICALIDMPATEREAGPVLSDIQRLSRKLPVIVLCSASNISSGIDAIRAGAADFVIKEVEIGNLAARIEKTLGRPAPAAAEDTASEPPRAQGWTPGQMIVGRSRRMLDAIKLARRAASYPVTVLLLGESGTGKELFARWIHQMSERASGPFVGVNLAAIPTDLVESTLFGHVKGAFTGAVGPRVGKFGQAQGGTLLLDEITELRLELQPKLLRVLQEGEFELVGGEKTHKTDARVIAATNRAILQSVEGGEFRSDLLYRLKVMAITLPPLRERREDIPYLTRLFLDKYGKMYGRPSYRVDDEAMERLAAHHWPGNIRELENLIQRAVIVADGDTVGVADLFDEEPPARESTAPVATEGGTLEDMERRYIEEVLQRTAGHQGEAAKILGIDRKTLYNKIMKYGLGRALQRKVG